MSQSNQDMRIAFCPMWAYSRCNYKVYISRPNSQQEWTNHMRQHFREDDGDLPDGLHCWFHNCPAEAQGMAFESLSNDVYDRLENFYRFLQHTWDHFVTEPWRTENDLRSDDIEMLMTAWLNHEVWDAFWSPQIPERQDMPLPAMLFLEFSDTLRELGYDPTSRDLVHL